MICAIMQPTYLPWLGYFDLIDQVDSFVFLSNVQLVKRSWQVRNRIKTMQGELFLTVPIKKNDTSRPLIQNALISYDENWQKQHLNSIRYAYQKTPYFSIVFEWFSDVLFNQYQYLKDLNITIITDICKKIGISTDIIDSSLWNDLEGSKDSLLADICCKIGADTYLSAKGSAEYIELERPGGNFVEKGINLFYHNYEHPLYKQNGSDFLPYMCILDLLFNEGFENALNIIRQGRRDSIHYKDMS